MNIDPKGPSRRATSRRTADRRYLGLGIALGFAFLLWGGWSLFSPSGTQDFQENESLLLYTAKKGPLTISVTESGTIDNREKLVVKSEVEGKTTILFLVPEGTNVRKGELIVELDASSLEEEKTTQQIALLKAEAAYIHARENLEVTRSEGESNIAKAQLEYDFARTDLKKYLEGEYPQELQKAEANISIAKEELQRAEEKLDWSRRLHEEGHITRSELEADGLEAKRKEIEVELAQSELELLTNYTHKRKLDELQSNELQAEKALERIKRKAAADNTQAEADLKAKESEFARQQDQLDKIKEKIANCRITAPADGMVVYATSSTMRWRGQEEPLQEGQEVREGQELIHLPTTSSMMAEVKIHESSLTKVRVGLPVVVTVDALPGTRFTGRVGRIALLPDATSAWINPDLKVYSTEIYLDGDGSGLRTGMTCQVEIIVEQYDDAVYVPLQSVVRVNDQTVVYVADKKNRINNNTVSPRPVTIGLDNNRVVRIIEGLAAGEQVLLTPPLARSEAPIGERLIGPVESKAESVSGITIRPLRIELSRIAADGDGESQQKAETE